MIYPSRTLHNGEKGADVQQGPVSRFLFRLRPCINLFSYYYLLLFHTLIALKMTKRDTGVIGERMICHSKIDVIEAATNVFFEIYALTTGDLSSCRIDAHTLKFRAHHRGLYSAQYML